MSDSHSGTYADRLAKFCVDLEPEAIPDAVLHQAQLSALDFLGVTLAGGLTPAARIVAAQAIEQGGKREATVIGSDSKLPAAQAALVNGTQAHSIELDDHEAHMRSKVHPGAVVMPAAWAMTERRGRTSGADFLAAVVVGYDVIGRLSAATDYPDYLGKVKGFHTTPLFGPFAAAATAGRLLGLTAVQLSHAFGIAGSLCSGLQETVSAGAMVKPYHAGWAAHSGIIAAQLAARGYTGPRSIFEGRRGFFRAYCGEGHFDLGVVDEKFGIEFDISLIMYKPYACGGGIHPSLTAIDQLRAEHHLAPADIEEVVVRTSQHVIDTFATPAETKWAPVSGPQAQHSLPYAAATLIVDGVALTEQFTDEAVKRPAVRALAQRVRVEADPGIQSDDPEDEPAGVLIRLTDGGELRTEVRGGKGSLAVPMTDAELVDKYRRLAAPLIGDDTARRIESSVLDLTVAADVSGIPASLARSR